jgi:alanyl-tRNA synthetase
MTIELAEEKGLKVDEKEFKKAFKTHQEISKKGSEQKFAGGLADDSEKTTNYHTATHLMLAGLRKVLGDDVHQKGSNITGSRLRFDFNHDGKLTDEVKLAVEKYVNDAIAADAQQILEEMDKEDAKAQGVVGSFWEKYPDRVKVFTFKDETGKIWTQELCGGPHAERTGNLGSFKIKKEQSCGRGVRRIKAILS